MNLINTVFLKPMSRDCHLTVNRRKTTSRFYILKLKIRRVIQTNNGPSSNLICFPSFLWIPHDFPCRFLQPKHSPAFPCSQTSSVTRPKASRCMAGPKEENRCLSDICSHTHISIYLYNVYPYVYIYIIDIHI